MRRARALPLIALLLSMPAPGRAAINTCVGPNGVVLYTDRDCPPGFALKSSVPGTRTAPADESHAADWERNCAHASGMTAEEVAAATAAVERLLASARKEGNQVRVDAWEGCLALLQVRKGELSPAPPPETDLPGPPPEREKPADPSCREGVFTTENGPSSYDVYFTNQSGGECREVKAYCLCSVSLGAYKQSRNIAVSGEFPPGIRTHLTNIPITGPVNLGIDWSWCKFK